MARQPDTGNENNLRLFSRLWYDSNLARFDRRRTQNRDAQRKTANHLRTTLLVAVLLASSISINAKPIPEIVKEWRWMRRARLKRLGTGFFISSDGLPASSPTYKDWRCQFLALKT